jgi:hypothetical protein
MCICAWSKVGRSYNPSPGPKPSPCPTYYTIGWRLPLDELVAKEVHRQPLVHMAPYERVVAEGLASEPVAVLLRHLRRRRVVRPALRQHADSVLAHAIVGPEETEAAHPHLVRVRATGLGLR